MGLFTSLFGSGKPEEDSQKKVGLQQFDVLKYDGIRALRINKAGYAVKCFVQALQIQQDFETMRYLLAAYNALNKVDEALATLDAMEGTGEDQVETLLMRANFLYMNEHYPEAMADCEQIIQLDPGSFLAYYLLAKTEQKMGELEKAVGHLDQATGISDDFAEGYALRAELYLATGKGNEALVDVKKVIKLTPDEETAYLLRGRIYELLGDADEALCDYQEALELNPFNDTAYLLCGRLLMAQAKYTEAIAVFDEATDHIENFAKAYAARAIAKRHTGDHTGASADEATANELDPEEIEDPDENPNFDNLYKGGIF